MKKVLLVFAFPIILTSLSIINNSNYKNINVVKAEESSGISSNNGVVNLSILNSGDYIYKESDTDNEEARTALRFNNWLKENYPDFGTVNLKYKTTDTIENMVSALELGTSDCDLMCPSEYAVQKLVNSNLIVTVQDKMEKYGLENYETYASSTIRNYLKNISVGKEGKVLDDYAIGYMWGTLGICFNPDYQVFKDRGYSSDKVIEDFSSYNTLWDKQYEKSILIKDSMRDTYFVGLAKHFDKELNDLRIRHDNGEIDDDSYNNEISNILNQCDDNTMGLVKSELDVLKKNIYGLEVDSGKQDIVIGNIGVNVAWSGDAVYAMDLADENVKEGDVGLCYSVPLNGSNVWSDCWVMPKNDARSQATEEAACLFLEFMSDPVTASENMDWIGYTSFIGGDDVLELARFNHDSRADLVGVENPDDEYAPFSIYYTDPNTSELTMAWYPDCHYKVDEDPLYDNVELYFGETVYDENDEDITTLDDLAPLGEKYNERFVIDEEWEVIDLSYMFKDTLSSDYDDSDCIFYSDEYLPFLNEDGSQNICVGRQFFTQYPTKETLNRCIVMRDFGSQNAAMIRMWENFKANNIEPWIIVLFSVEVGVILAGVIVFSVSKKVSKNKLKKRREQAK